MLPPLTSTVPCTKSGGCVTPGDVTASPAGSVTSACRLLVEEPMGKLGAVEFAHAPLKTRNTSHHASRISAVIVLSLATCRGNPITSCCDGRNVLQPDGEARLSGSIRAQPRLDG